MQISEVIQTLLYNWYANILENLPYLFLWFMIYSFIGWFYESTICSPITYHKLINRGFLKGPYCPIYGVGVIMNWMLLGQIASPVVIFFIAMATSGLVEYFASYAMEKLFQARWWDYRKYRFNINGRICLYGCLIFGISNVIIVKVLHPFIMGFTNLISIWVLHSLSIALFAVFAADIIMTTIQMKDFDHKLAEISDAISKKKLEYLTTIGERKMSVGEMKLKAEEMKSRAGAMKSKAGDRINAIIEEEIITRYQNAKAQLKNSDTRIIRAFPKFKSTKYNEIVKKIKEIISREKEKNDKSNR